MSLFTNNFGSRLSWLLSFLAISDCKSTSNNIDIDNNDMSVSISSLANGCIGKEDGEYWLQLGDSLTSYTPVYLQCSNEYVILDVSRDSNLLNYFSSFEMWHTAIGAPKNSNPVDWYEWFLPETSDINSLGSYYISPDCSTCDITDEIQTHDDQTSYWMTGNLAKLHWPVIGFNECDMDYDTYQCYDCSNCMKIGDGCEPEAYVNTETDFDHSGICGVTIQATDHEVMKTRRVAQAATGVVNYKPSIGTNGQFCMCYQPQSLEYYSLTDTQAQMVNSLKDMVKTDEKNRLQKDTTETDLDLRETNRIHLSQDDFVGGTYRITESGTYIITEDITFDFNKDDDYWPRSDQNEDYTGAGGYRDAYHLGFFAGITIECNYVTINLNSHELKQSLEFYYQQRWFAIIELGNQQFLPGQGPAFFGSDPVSIEDITIYNGILGLTSHFGIHGNFPTNLEIKNLHIRDFVTHGLQLNGWNNLVLDSIEVGPSSKIEYLRGDYGHGRIILQRLRHIEEDMLLDGTIDTNKVSFANHNNELKSVTDIADELEYAMTMAYTYALNRGSATGGLYSQNDYINPDLLDLTNDDDFNKWDDIKKQFIQESGFPSASSITGIFLNFYGASVFSYTMYTTHQSKNGKLSNIYIHDISHDISESMRFGVAYNSGQLYPTPWNSDIPAEHAFGGKNKLADFYGLLNADDDAMDTNKLSSIVDSDFKYRGSVMTDAYFSMGMFSDSWDYLGFLQIDRASDDDTSLSDWVQGLTYADNSINDDTTTDDADDNPLISWRLGCNQDIMGHSGKGLLGLRIDGVSDLTLSNIKVENLHEHSVLGSDACGNYKQFTPENNGGHFKQSLPMQRGFSGNNLQGISIISSTDVRLEDSIIINNLNNNYALAFGMSFWTGNDVTIAEDALIMIKNVNAGSMLAEGRLTYDSLPNQAPEACSVRLEIDTSADYYGSTINMNNNGMNNIVSCSVNGHVACLDSDTKAMYGNYFDSQDVCDEIQSVDDLQAIGYSHNVQRANLVEAGSDGSSSSSSSSSNGIDSQMYGASSLLAIGISAALVLIGALYCNQKICGHCRHLWTSFDQTTLLNVNADYGSV